MRDLVRGLYRGSDLESPALPGIVEIGIAYTHQNIPDVPQYKAEMKSWLQDSAFWQAVGPTIRLLAETTPTRASGGSRAARGTSEPST